MTERCPWCGGPPDACGYSPRDEHPLAGLVDHVCEAGMVQMQTELAAALPVTWSAIDRCGDSWCIHIAWTAANGGGRWAVLWWDPDRAFEVCAEHVQPRRFALPGEALAAVIEMVNASGLERQT